MMDSSAVWNGSDPTLSSQDDFQQFLDMGISNLGEFDFQQFDNQQDQGAQMMHQNDGDVMDSRMQGTHQTTLQDHMPTMTTATSHPAIVGTPISHGHPSTDSLGDLDAQIQYLQQQRHQQQQRQLLDQQRNYYAQNQMIPPTPNSMKMLGNGPHNQFYNQSDPQQRAMLERFQMQVKEQQEVSLIHFCRIGPELTWNE
jgi:hypothetical protein